MLSLSTPTLFMSSVIISYNYMKGCPRKIIQFRVIEWLSAVKAGKEPSFELLFTDIKATTLT